MEMDMVIPNASGTRKTSFYYRILLIWRVRLIRRKRIQGIGVVVFVLLFSSLLLISQPRPILICYGGKPIRTVTSENPQLEANVSLYTSLDRPRDNQLQDFDLNPFEELRSGEGEVPTWNSSRIYLDWIRNRTRRKYSVPTNPGTPHSVIAINNDSDFVSQGWSGTGIQSDPYRIENLSITAGYGNSCIEVRNTRKHFVINECQLNWSSYGIELWNVSNAHIANSTFLDIFNLGVDFWRVNDSVVANNYFADDPWCGVYLESSNCNKITNNTFADTWVATYMANSHLNRLTNNTSSHSKGRIYMDRSNNNWIINQTCEWISLYDSFSNTIERNQVLFGGLELYASSNNTVIENRFQGGGLIFPLWYSGMIFRQRMVSGNTVNGKPLVYWQDQSGGSVPLGAGQVVLVGCSGVTVNNQIISDCYQGIVLFWSNQSHVSENVLHGSEILLLNTNTTTIDYNDCTYSFSGIHLNYHCWNNLVSHNTCNYNYYSIRIYSRNTQISDNFVHGNECGIRVSGWNNIAVNNTCSDNDWWGIYIYRDNHRILNNTCVFNKYGIYTIYSENTSISGNICKANEIGINVKGDKEITVIHNVCTRNADNGIYVYLRNPTWDRNVTITQNLCNGNGNSGIRLSNSSNVEVVENRCVDNFSHGICVAYKGVNNTVTGNECTGNEEDGIKLINHGNCTITYNLCFGNERRGIFIDDESSNNTIHWNVFADNWVGNGIELGGQNDFDYNLWSDYQGSDWNFDGFGDTPYFVSGPGEGCDPHPLMQWPGAVPASIVMVLTIAMTSFVIGGSIAIAVFAVMNPLEPRTVPRR